MMELPALKLGLRGLFVLVFAVCGMATSFAAKRFVVTIDSPLAYQSLKLAQLGVPVKSPALQMFAQSGARVQLLFDKLQMVVVAADSEKTSDKTLVSLKGKHGIVDIEEEFFIPAPNGLPQSVVTAGSMEQVEVPWGIKAIRAPDAWTSANSGRGSRVLVLDTGIDRDHPDLASRFEKGQNFAEVDEPEPPYEYYDNISHGTHVAGMILADGKVTGLVGVAPEAQLLSARVCSKKGCSSVSILSGINWGIQEKVDVMNLSLGGPFDSPSGGRAYEAAKLAGVVVVCASGNDGVGQVSFPAAYDSNIAVGAVDENFVKADFSNWGPELDVMAPGVNVVSSVPRGSGVTTDLKVDLGDGQGMVRIDSLPVQGAAVQADPLVGDLIPVGLGKPEDYIGLSVQGKIALILRGEITFIDKVNNAIQAGVSGVVIYNNQPGVLGASLGDGVSVAIPVASITQEAGLELSAKGPVSVSLHSRTSDFEKMAGTSMASPHVAGVAALIRGVNRLLTPDQVREIIVSTAQALSPNDANQYGFGLVDAQAAVNKALGIEFLLPTGSGF
ncbi:MAG: S8 family serine peptidase [Bdellovibrionales bacterium]|nr:S8 family serine peptidase [Bdellovibrionales bacterium]